MRQPGNRDRRENRGDRQSCAAERTPHPKDEHGREWKRLGQEERRADIRPFTSRKRPMGDTVMLFVDRCVMCSRCVRFCREISGTSELFVEGRGYKEEINIFPGHPLNNKLAGNVVDICPVGALLDKDFLFKQRVWLLKQTPSISPVDAGGENIYLEHNEGVLYRIKPRFNADVNKWWISDDTRYSYKAVNDPARLRVAMRLQYGSQVEIWWLIGPPTGVPRLGPIAGCG